MEKPQSLDLNYPRELSIFKQFLERRKEGSQNDLKNLAEKFNIPEKTLEKIKKKIREILEGAEYLSTTVHFRLRVIDYLRLSKERMDQAVENPNEIFHYPVYYQDFEKERPDLIFVGSLRISLCDIIPSLNEKRKQGYFRTSLDFHNALLEYLETKDWQEEIRSNLEQFINKEFSNYKENFRSLVCESISNVIISLLSDYKDFFKKNKIIQTPSEIFEINRQLAEVLLENFETIEPILEICEIRKKDLEDIKEQGITRVTSEFIFAICILGNLVHIGAEYEKFNELRGKLGLEQLDEPKTPQERFIFFEITAEKKAENDTLRFLLGISSRDVLVKVATYEGHEPRVWSPIDEEVRKRLHILEFYLNLKKRFGEIKSSFETTYFSREIFSNLINVIDYFSHLNEKERKIVEEIFGKLPTNGDKNLEEWARTYNEVLEKEEIKEVKVNRLKIFLDLLKKKILIFIFKNYIQGDFEILKKALPEQLFNYFWQIKKSKIMETYEPLAIKEKEELSEFIESTVKEKGLFYGLRLPLVIREFTKDDVVNFVSLLKIVEENFDEKISMQFSPFKLS